MLLEQLLSLQHYPLSEDCDWKASETFSKSHRRLISSFIAYTKPSLIHSTREVPITQSSQNLFTSLSLTVLKRYLFPTFQCSLHACVHASVCNAPCFFNCVHCFLWFQDHTSPSNTMSEKRFNAPTCLHTTKIAPTFLLAVLKREGKPPFCSFEFQCLEYWLLDVYSIFLNTN